MSIRAHELDLVRQVLDRQILDRDEVPCGKVDDLEFTTRQDGTLEIAAILVGPGAYLPRLAALFHWAGEKILGKRIVRIPWDQVEDIPGAVKLKVTAQSLHLQESQYKAHRIIEKIPWSSRS
jgi:hypothetical protein